MENYLTSLLHEFSSVQFSHSVVSDPLQPHGMQHTRLLYPSPTPRACSNSCPLSWWCHPTISSSVVPFSPCLQSFPASGSFPVSQFFTSGGQSIGVSTSASVLPISAYCIVRAYCIIMTNEKEWCQDKTEDLYLMFQRKEMNHSGNCHHVKFQSAVLNQWLMMALKRKQWSLNQPLRFNK